MSLRIKHNKISEASICYYIFWFFLQVGKGFGLVSKDSAFIGLLVCAVPFALAKMLLTKWNKATIIKFLLLNATGIIAMVCSGETTYWLSFFCITVAIDIDIRKVLKISVIVRGVMFVVRTTLAVLGIIDMEKAYRFAGNALVAIRYGLGYGHPNTTQVELFVIILLVFCIYGKRLKWPFYIGAAAYSYFIFTYTNSRTSLVLTLVYIAGAAIINMGQGRILQLTIKAWSSASWIICMLLAAFGCLMYSTTGSLQALGTLSSRFLTATATIENEYIHLFGTKGVFTDLGYVYILYNGGLLIAAIYLIGINVLLMKLRKKNEGLLLWAFACLAIFAILEHSLFSTLTNGLLLFLKDVFFPDKPRQAIQAPNSDSKVKDDNYE